MKRAVGVSRVLKMSKCGLFVKRRMPFKATKELRESMFESTIYLDGDIKSEEQLVSMFQQFGLKDVRIRDKKDKSGKCAFVEVVSTG